MPSKLRMTAGFVQPPNCVGACKHPRLDILFVRKEECLLQVRLDRRHTGQPEASLGFAKALHILVLLMIMRSADGFAKTRVPTAVPRNARWWPCI